MPPKSTWSSLFKDHPVLIGLAIRLLLMFALPPLIDDGLLLQGVRYTDIDYDVFTDAANHVANGRSPYERHTYRYTPFLAKLLALPVEYGGDGEGSSGGGGLSLWHLVFSMRYFGKILFCIADVICGYIIVVLRRRKRIMASSPGSSKEECTKKKKEEKRGWTDLIHLSPELRDALWWLYNPLPINICTRGSAESLVVLLPVLGTVAIADMYQPNSGDAGRKRRGSLPIVARACFAGIIHGIGIHAKLYPVIYTISFMANFSRQQQQREVVESTTKQKKSTTKQKKESKDDCDDVGWRYLLSEQMQEVMGGCFCCDLSNSKEISTFPWMHPKRILVLAIFWVQRLFFTMSSVLFLAVSMGTVALLTYLAVHYHGQEALEEGLLYHFQRVDHRHNYSIYWYWIYLARGRAEMAQNLAQSASSAWGHVPLIPQILILGFSSLGIAPYDLSFALFCQTFAFVAFNKVMTAQYFTWYLCLLPLCSSRVNWKSKGMILSLGLLFVSIITWLLSAFSLEMLGYRSHRQVWVASLFFFIANVNLMRSILNGYLINRKAESSSQPGQGWARKIKEN